MLTRRNFTLASLAWATAGCEATQPLGAHFASLRQSSLVAEATREGTVRIDSATGVLYDIELTDTFKRLYPGIKLDYRRANSSALYKNFLKETAAGRDTADILISSAMDLQFKLVNDGFALAYESPEKPFLPDWAVWNDQAYTVVADPLVFAYNKTLMPPEDVPRRISIAARFPLTAPSAAAPVISTTRRI
jgi:iron(III) transport system substrate-binding protein